MDEGVKIGGRIAGWTLTIVLAMVSGVIFGLALPGKGISWLGWLALAPLFLAASRIRGISAFGLGLIAGAGAVCMVGHPWRTIEQFGNIAGAFGMLGLALGCVAAGFSVLARRLSPLMLSLVVACLGTGVEYASQWLFPINLGIIQAYNVPLLQITPITGVWGISFLLWFSNASLAAAVIRPGWAHVPASMVVLLLLLQSWGADQAGNLPSQERVGVAAVQGMSLFDLARFTNDAAKEGADMVTWPELVLDDLSQGVAQVSEQLGIVLVTGYTERAGSGKPYNSAAVFDSGRCLGSARKTHRFGVEKRYFAQNGRQRVFSPRNLPKIGVAICYDTNFTDVVRKLARRGARVVFVPNSDPYTPAGVLHSLHAALMPIRAAENRVAIVRADTTGLSQIIDARGNVRAYQPLGKDGQITQHVFIGGAPTFYTRMGDWFAWFCLALSAVFAAACGRKTKKRGKLVT